MSVLSSEAASRRMLLPGKGSPSSRQGRGGLPDLPATRRAFTRQRRLRSVHLHSPGRTIAELAEAAPTLPRRENSLQTQHALVSSSSAARPRAAGCVPKWSPSKPRRTKLHTRSIPPDSKQYYVSGACEVQLSPDTVIGIRTFGRTQSCQMTIKWRRADGGNCTYGEWKAQELLEVEGTHNQGWSSVPYDEDLPPSARLMQQSRVKLIANNVEMLATASGHQHALTVYLRHTNQFAPPANLTVPM